MTFETLHQMVVGMRKRQADRREARIRREMEEAGLTCPELPDLLKA